LFALFAWSLAFGSTRYPHARGFAPIASELRGEMHPRQPRGGGQINEAYWIG
jgi:hypothetical protein